MAEPAGFGAQDWTVLHGDAVSWLRQIPTASIDAVVTDPPYGIGFMGHEWDQPGAYAPVVSDGGPAPIVGGKRRRSQPKPDSGNGHARDRRPLTRRNPQGPGRASEGARFGGPLGYGAGSARGNGSVRGGAMHAGRYDLSREANELFERWCEAWAIEALRVLKPGGFLVCFGSTRTYHRLVAGLEDAGFEIRDQLDWLFGSGFPKSRVLAPGVGTALKPGHEPICLARAPFAGTTQANHDAHGTAGLNIDACKISVADPAYARNCSGDRGHGGTRSIDQRGATDFRPGGGSASESGRWPTNVILDAEAGAQLDEQTGELRSDANPTRRGADKFRSVYGDFAGQERCDPARGADAGGASRFYYCAKTSPSERNAGLPAGEENDHPTVKPIDLMRWLVRLTCPPGGVVLDLFAGSGTTGCAAVLEDRGFVGIERELRYVQLAEWRTGWWAEHPEGVHIVDAIEAARARLKRTGEGQLDLLGGTA
jgi:site-specific DNA-methyltransferase (adenine-specific)